MQRIRIFVVPGEDQTETLALTVALERALSRAGIAVCTSRSDTAAIQMREQETLVLAGDIEIGDA